MKKPPTTDNLYTVPYTKVPKFCFDEQVANVFPDMIQRSVPGYETIIETIGTLTRQYAQPYSHLYDLGCSLGAATLAMQANLSQPDCVITAIDNSSAMVEKARQHLPATIDLRCENIQDSLIENASVVILNFTLQFLSPNQRLPLLRKIAQGMLPGGLLVLSEKLAFPDPIINNCLTDLHLKFKENNGYSRLEIAQKRASLENVLIPDTLAIHKQRLQQAGFQHIDLCYQYFNFCSIIAFTATPTDRRDGTGVSV